MSRETRQASFDQLLSAGDFPVKMSVALESAKDLTEAEQGSGLNSCESSKKYSPLGLLERMLKDSLPKDSTKCLTVWKERVTPAKHIVFQLARLVPSTKGTGYSLLRTVTTQECEGGVMEIREGCNAHYKLRDQIAGMIPTLTKSDATMGDLNGKEYNGKTRHAMKIGNALAMLPTITCNTGKNTSPGINFDMREKKCRLDGVFMNQIGKQNGLLLQPAFAEWMQGFPEEWTDLPASEMPSSRSRSTRSSKQSQTLKKESK
jgi:hypothetical protein